MATDKPRFSVTFTGDSFNKIKKFKEENNISTQSKAVARLVELAINEIELERITKNSPSAAEAAPGEILSETDTLRSSLLHNFDQLNQEGRELLVDQSDTMVSSGKYIKSNSVKLGKAKDA